MASLHALLYDDASNTALRQVLSTQLSIGELATLVQVCTAFRPWLVDYGAQLFLGVTGDNAAGEHRVLRPWQPHLLLNGQPAMCKKRAVFVTPCVYSCYGRTADGRQMVSAVRPGASIDTERSGLTLRLVRASTRDEAEVLGIQNAPLFAKKTPRKGKGGGLLRHVPHGRPHRADALATRKPTGHVPAGGRGAPRAQGHAQGDGRVHVHERRLLRRCGAAENGRGRARAARAAAQALALRLVGGPTGPPSRAPS